MLTGADQTEDEDKFNKMVNLEMEEQRKNIKTKRDEFIKKKKVEVEKDEPKKNKITEKLLITELELPPKNLIPSQISQLSLLPSCPQCSDRR